MVSFNWGRQTLSLPRSASFIETQMKDYVLTGDKEFRRKVKTAKDSVDDSEPNSAALKEQLTEIKQLRQQGEEAHNQGNHKESEELLKQALDLLDG